MLFQSSFFPVNHEYFAFLCSVLRNNCFTGIIPEGIRELKELEVLDLGYNNFSGPLPAELGSNLSLILL